MRSWISKTRIHQFVNNMRIYAQVQVYAFCWSSVCFWRQVVKKNERLQLKRIGGKQPPECNQARSDCHPLCPQLWTARAFSRVNWVRWAVSLLYNLKRTWNLLQVIWLLNDKLLCDSVTMNELTSVLWAKCLDFQVGLIVKWSTPGKKKGSSLISLLNCCLLFNLLLN